MTKYRANVALAERHVLAEGPVWIGPDSSLLWIDVVRGEVHLGELDGNRIVPVNRLDFEGMVGAAVVSEDGDVLVAGQESLLVVRANGKELHGPRIVPPGSQRRTNDGAVDPAGRFLIGTLPFDDSLHGETLARVEDDGSLTEIDGDLSLSNGLAWSPDGTLLYSTDTVPGIIWVRSYDAFTGRVGERREHIAVTDGFPDGICVDEEGSLWVAIWGGGEVRRFDTAGVHTDTVEVGVPHVSSVAFVGAHRERLLITTASRDLTPAELQIHSTAGFLFLADVEVRGTPTTPWSASWMPQL